MTAIELAVDRTATTAPGPAVVLHEVSKVYGHGPQSVLAVDRLSLQVQAGEFVCVVGASGCGKTTLLSMVSGLEPVSGGTITIAGGHRPAQMFQESALFPWLTVRGNVEVALRLRGVPRRAREAEARELLASVHLADFADKRPHELSGGMRQRAALARTLAQRTPVLLMDEPFGALDAMTRDMLHDEIERVCRERELTVLFVTHNVREAARLGDRIVLLSSRPGRVETEYAVDIPRPRRIDSPEIATLSATITDRLRAEVRRHGQ